MSLPDEIVFLFDCDNTRLDNDRVQGRSLRTHLASEFGLSASTGRSGDLMGFLGVAVTPVFSSDLGRHLLGELRELLGLRGHRLELLACMRGRQLNEL
jgi:hypothetical protein